MSRGVGAGHVSERDLLLMPPRALEALFARHPTSTLPDGHARGTVLVLPGSGATRALAALVRAVAWKGKVVDASAGTLLNLVGPLGIPAVRAEMRVGASLSDGRSCVVLDYSRTSRVARVVRDELREVTPGLWLGVAHVRGRRVGWFVLRLAVPGARA